MTLDLLKVEVGPWPMNSYIIRCLETREIAIVDPGADAKKITDAAYGMKVKYIFITHGHADHVGALNEVRKKTGGLVCVHPADASRFNLKADVELSDRKEIPLGSNLIKVYHIPGHTDGQVCFDLLDERILVGDTVFVGGPGKTWSDA